MSRNDSLLMSGNDMLTMAGTTPKPGSHNPDSAKTPASERRCKPFGSVFDFRGIGLALDNLPDGKARNLKRAVNFQH